MCIHDFDFKSYQQAFHKKTMNRGVKITMLSSNGKIRDRLHKTSIKKFDCRPYHCYFNIFPLVCIEINLERIGNFRGLLQETELSLRATPEHASFDL